MRSVARPATTTSCRSTLSTSTSAVSSSLRCPQETATPPSSRNKDASTSAALSGYVHTRRAKDASTSAALSGYVYTRRAKDASTSAVLSGYVHTTAFLSQQGRVYICGAFRVRSHHRISLATRTRLHLRRFQCTFTPPPSSRNKDASTSAALSGYVHTTAFLSQQGRVYICGAFRVRSHHRLPLATRTHLHLRCFQGTFTPPPFSRNKDASIFAALSGYVHTRLATDASTSVALSGYVHTTAFFSQQGRVYICGAFRVRSHSPRQGRVYICGAFRVRLHHRLPLATRTRLHLRRFQGTFTLAAARMRLHMRCFQGTFTLAPRTRLHLRHFHVTFTLAPRTRLHMRHFQGTIPYKVHSVTCHPADVTFPPLLQPTLILNLATPKGCKAELSRDCELSQLC